MIARWQSAKCHMGAERVRISGSSDEVADRTRMTELYRHGHAASDRCAVNGGLSTAHELSLRLVPDALWEMVEPLTPPFVARPQGGGSAPADDRAVFTEIVYVLTSGCAWRHLPPSFGVTVPTAHRRFSAWVRDGGFVYTHHEAVDRLRSAGELDWTAAILDAASGRGKKGDS